jgi:hypothetical protein
MEQLNKILSPENEQWLQQFINTHGRAPVVLQIGNIANNGYNNAKILTEAGFDCDVICYDYYHMMGCPEWEDADLSGRLNDDFKPNWTAMDLGDFKRPEWFAQGPLKVCINYLCARRDGLASAPEQWRRLLVYSRCLSPQNSQDILMLLEPLAKRVYWKLINTIHTPLVHALSSWARKLKKRSPRPLVRALSYLARALKRMIYGQSLTIGPDQIFLQRAEDLISEFKRQFPTRTDSLSMEDLHPYGHMFQEWRRLFAHYDIVIGFSTDPFLPLLDSRSYFAIEHGTLRTIPFDENGQGRRTALAYNQAAHSFVTNFDCAGSAERLAPGRYTLINHPYDEDRGLTLSGAEDLRRELCEKLDADFLIFHPTRHDWVEGTGFADKKNEVLLEAFAKMRAQGLRVGLIACEWGANVAQSKKLLRSFGCYRHVQWIQPMAIVPFERMCRACDVVADQFKLGAFGGVVFKAMAVGAPILTYLNESQATQQYPVSPPVINCRTTEEILSKLLPLMADRDSLSAIGLDTRHWVKQYHGKAETVNAQVNQFRLHYGHTTNSAL